MKSSLLASRRLRVLGTAVTCLALVSVLRAADPVKGAVDAGDKAADKASSKIDHYRADNSDMNKAEVKAALDQIDAELDHLDRLADSAPTKDQKAEIKAQYAILKARRNDLKKEFTRARYESFKADLKAETDKATAWTKDTFSSKPQASSAVRATNASADDASSKITDYRTDSNDLTKAEVKASLAKLDADIDLLDAKIDAVSDPVRKQEMKQNLAMLKARRSELNSEFRKARYDALVADVKAEWNKITN